METDRRAPGGDETLPAVSVILPVRNEARFLARGLEAVLAQDYPADRMEVIVADGMSDDGTRELVEALRLRDPRVERIDNPGRIVPTGLNAAIARARGEIVVRVDGHCEIERDYVRNCVRHLTEDGVDGVGGPLDTVGGDPVAETIAVAMSSPFGVGDSAFRTVKDRTMLVDTVAFPAYTRAILDRIGPFDEELVRNQDDEYNSRLRKAGAKVLLAADVRSRYYSRSSFRSLWRQYYQYGYWKVRVIQKLPFQMRPRQIVPAAFVSALLLLLALSPVSGAARLALALTAGAYAAASLVASARAGAGRGWRVMTRLPIAFATLHVAYGLGFLTGLAKFWNRWADHETPRPGMTRPAGELTGGR